MEKSPILPPFKRFCVTIGNLPSSYVDSMSYYECVMWLCKYLKDTVIPAVNENAEAVNELINWFNNLDVQDEIDNKLDEMVESGELEEIMASYLNSKAVFGFDKITDMTSSTNLINGSYARTCGSNEFNNGLGSLYKIRTVTNQDSPDGYDLIAMNDESLVAERIKELKKKYIFIGDSFNTTDTPVGGTQIVPWSSEVVQYLGLSANDYYNSGVSGAGWTNGTTFLQQLQTIASSITDKKVITDIVVLGGINDPASADLYTAFRAFSTYVKNNFPNATVTIGMISWAKGTDNRNNLRDKIQVYNWASTLSNFRVIDNAFTFYHNYLHYQADGHPNSYGSATIGYFVANYLKGGTNNVTWKKTGNIASTGNDLNISGDTIGTFKEIFSNGNEIIQLTIPNITISQNITQNGTYYNLGKLVLDTAYFDTNLAPINVTGWLYTSSNTYHNFNGRLVFKPDGTIQLGIDSSGNTINNVTVLHLCVSGYIVIPAEYC